MLRWSDLVHFEVRLMKMLSLIRSKINSSNVFSTKVLAHAGLSIVLRTETVPDQHNICVISEEGGASDVFRKLQSGWFGPSKQHGTHRCAETNRINCFVARINDPTIGVQWCWRCPLIIQPPLSVKCLWFEEGVWPRITFSNSSISTGALFFTPAVSMSSDFESIHYQSFTSSSGQNMPLLQVPCRAARGSLQFKVWRFQQRHKSCGRSGRSQCPPQGKDFSYSKSLQT